MFREVGGPPVGESGVSFGARPSKLDFARLRRTNFVGPLIFLRIINIRYVPNNNKIISRFIFDPPFFQSHVSVEMSIFLFQ